MGGARLPAAVLLGALGAVVLMRAASKLRGSTLLAPWAWSCFSLAALTAAEAVAAIYAEGTSNAVAHWRYLAATTTVTPLIALLGAKRPQDRAWQWIVLSLVVLLALPSLKSLALDGGAPPAPHAAWQWLLTTILIAGFLNFAPTRNCAAAVLFVFGQFVVLAGYLPGFAARLATVDRIWGLAAIVAALWAAQFAASRKKAVAAPVDRLWLDFRDAFGALWALRVAERFNATSAQCGWRVWLGWNALQFSDESRAADRGAAQELAPEVAQGVHQALKSLLWRFVSAEWIAERLRS
jgi:hypothetical protein